MLFAAVSPAFLAALSQSTLPHCHRPPAPWTTREEWALEDEAKGHTIGDGKHRVTFWTSLAASQPDLGSRSPEELHAQAVLTMGTIVGSEPRVLTSATRVTESRWAGFIDGHARVLNVASEGRLVSGTGFIESLTGEIFSVEMLQEWPTDDDDDDAGKSVEPAHEDGMQSFLAAGLQAFYSFYVPAAVACALLVGAQLIAAQTHTVAPHSAMVTWQEGVVSDAKNDVLDLERWMEARREVFADDQETFLRRLGELEPRVRASEARLTELKAAAL